MKEKRALLIKLGAIGDVIMAIPAAYELHLQGHAIDWVCGSAAAPVLGCYPWIRTFVVDEHAVLKGRRIDRTIAVMGLWRQIAGRAYAICGTLYYDRRYKILTLPVRAARRVSLSALDRERLLLPGRHHTDEYARILLGAVDGERPSHLGPVAVRGLPASLSPRDRRHRIVLVPGGAKNMLRDDALRRWPTESYVALAATLLERNVEVVLIGGPDDGWASPFFSGLSITDEIGQLSLLDTLALLDGADVVVTHDTGPLHLAGITKVSIVSIFGPTDPNGRLPQRPGTVAIWGGEGFACRPCYDGNSYAPCQHNGCMRQVTPAMVLEEITNLLVQRSTGLQSPRIVLPKRTVEVMNPL